MPTFRYSGYGAGGKTVTGTVEADSLREATLRLKRDGLFPKEVAAVDDVVGKAPFFRRGVSLAELALMTRRLATLVASSVPLFEGVTTLWEQEAPGPLKQVLSRVRDRLAEGGSLAAALAGEPAVFGESYVSMVAAGEAGGALDVILERLAEFLEDQQAVQSRVTAALAYPVLMAVVGTGVMLFLLAFVIPKIVVIFEQNKAALPFLTRVVMGASKLLRDWWWLIGAHLAGLMIAWRRASKKEDVRLKRDSFILRLPVVGPLVQRLILARFAKVLGLLLASGVPVIKALEITGDVVVNRRYRQYLKSVRESLIEGGTLSAALKSSPLFPPLLVHMIAVGEKGGELEPMLMKAGNAFEKEFDTSVARLMSLLEPCMVLAMGLAVGIVVMAVLLPIFELNQLVR